MRAVPTLTLTLVLSLLGGTPAPADPAPAPDDSLQEGLRELERGNLEGAIAAWETAATGYRGAGHAAGEAEARLRLGQARAARGDAASALADLERALQLATELTDRERVARTLAALGETQQRFGDLTLAAELLERALAHAVSPELEARILNGHGNLYEARGDHAAAAKWYRRSSARAREAGEVEAALTAQANALRAALLAEPDGSLTAALDSVLDETGTLPDSAAKARVLVHLGRSYMRLAAMTASSAAPALRSAARAFEAGARSAAHAGDARTQSFGLGYLGQIYERGGRAAEALALTRRALFLAQANGAVQALVLWHWQLARLHAGALRLDEAIESYRAAAITLQDLRSTGLAAATPGGETFESSVAPVFLGLVDLLLQRAASLEDADARERLLAEARATIEVLKAAELRDYFGDECVDAAAETTVGSVPDTVVVYPIVLPDRTELIVDLPNGHLRSVLVPVPSAELTAEVRRFRELLVKRTTREYRRPAANLYDWLLRPLAPMLADLDFHTLVFVPDGILRTVPMAALYDREKREFLIEQVAVAITPGLTLTDPKRIDPEHVELLSAGLSEAVQGYPALPYVRTELEAVQSVFEGTMLLDGDFISESVARELSGRELGIVHIASHGEFRSQSSDSFLLTYDGRIAMDRLADLVAATRFHGRPLELLTLSACETAAGDERAALGLAGVALRAGARSALATLWAVSDSASAELIGVFYRQLGETGVSRAEALRRAQLSLIQGRRYRHPGYWSAFLMISSWL